ncbi:MAG: TonB-dependent receptor [Candidatus Marinimicrobia bacterium]|nr:TonB-dependent receptor [Candidatus Neomarinimicrobiota bacterium]
MGIKQLRQIVLFTLLVGAGGYAQSSLKIIDVHPKDIPLNSFLDSLIQLYDIPLIYQDQQIAGIMISFDCDSCNMAELLTMMVEDTGLKWEIIGDQYVISKVNNPPDKKANPIISGFVSNAKTGQPLPNVNVYLKNTFTGAITDFNGYFSIPNVTPGVHTIVVSFIGYEKISTTIEVTDDIMIDVPLSSSVIDMSALEVFADRAIEEVTPVAFTNVEKAEIKYRLGSRDIPMALEAVPGVFTTYQGGGIGDSRLNVRGFDQSNMAILINGVPVNDMEHGYARWSIWEGIGDITSSIQLQRGLSADNLAIPFVGGTLNIITDHPQRKIGAKFRQEIGSHGYRKSIFNANSGIIVNRFSLTATVAHKTSDGYIENTWIDAWAYYLSFSFTPNPSHRLDFFVFGVPLRRGNNPFRRSIASYDHKYARRLGISDDIINSNAELGYRYNSTWGYVDKNFSGKQYWNDETHDRKNDNIIYEREHYYNRPQGNLNWYYKLTDKLNLTTLIYYSNGLDISTRPFGKVFYSDDDYLDWNAVIAENTSPDHYDSTYGGYISSGIIINKVHRQETVGAISRLTYHYGHYLKLSLGLDWRDAEVRKYGEVRDLLGGDAYSWDGLLELGDAIYYDFRYQVNWAAGYGQIDYQNNALNAYSSASLTKVNYTVFLSDRSVDPPDIRGSSLKGGVSYRLFKEFTIFTNLGAISKVPIIEQVIDDYVFVYNQDFKNEKITSIEFGMAISGFGGRLKTRSSIYQHIWENHTHIRGNTDDPGVEFQYSLPEVGEVHSGFELSAFFKPISFFETNASLTVGFWKMKNNVTTTIKWNEDYSDERTFYVKDLLVGNVPQTQLTLSSTIFPLPGARISIVYKFCDRYYANFDPRVRMNPADDLQSWKMPAYSLLDVHATFRLPFFDDRIEVQANIFNILDERYISDATETFLYDIKDFGHKAENAGVFFGMPRTFNLGLTVQF